MNKLWVPVFLLLVCLSSVAYGVNDAVISYTFNDDNVSGSTFYDQSGNGNDGTKFGTDNLVSVIGKDFQGRYFNSTKTQRIDTGYSMTLGDISVSFWAKADETENLQHGFVSQRRNTADTQYAGFNLKTSSGFCTPYSIEFQIFNNGLEHRTTCINRSAWADDTWHHIVGTYNHTSKEVSLFLDGQLYDSDIATFFMAQPGTYDMQLGATRGGGGAIAQYYEGDMDEFNFYQRVLSDSEIQELYTNPNPYTSFVNSSLGYGNVSFTTGAKDYGSMNSPADFTVSGNTLYLYTDRVYEFQNFYLGPGTALSTQNTTGSVVYVKGFNITLEGDVILSGIRNPGNKDVVNFTYNSRTYEGKLTGEGGGGFRNYDLGRNGQGLYGFGGGGGWIDTYPTGYQAGDGADGDIPFGTEGSGGYYQLNYDTTGTYGQAGNAATPGSAGGGGYVYVSASANNDVRITLQGGAGGTDYGEDGQDASASVSFFDGSWSITSIAYAFGGGGAGGIAGISGYNFILDSVFTTVTGTINTSGVDGGKGGNGGLTYQVAGATVSVSGARTSGTEGGGGGGGSAGDLYIYSYFTDIDSMTYVNDSGLRGLNGVTFVASDDPTLNFSNSDNAEDGVEGNFYLTEVTPLEVISPLVPIVSSSPLQVTYNVSDAGLTCNLSINISGFPVSSDTPTVGVTESLSIDLRDDISKENFSDGNIKDVFGTNAQNSYSYTKYVEVPKYGYVVDSNITLKGYDEKFGTADQTEFRLGQALFDGMSVDSYAGTIYAWDGGDIHTYDLYTLDSTGVIGNVGYGGTFQSIAKSPGNYFFGYSGDTVARHSNGLTFETSWTIPSGYDLYDVDYCENNGYVHVVAYSSGTGITNLYLYSTSGTLLNTIDMSTLTAATPGSAYGSVTCDKYRNSMYYIPVGTPPVTVHELEVVSAATASPFPSASIKNNWTIDDITGIGLLQGDITVVTSYGATLFADPVFFLAESNSEESNYRYEGRDPIFDPVLSVGGTSLWSHSGNFGAKDAPETQVLTNLTTAVQNAYNNGACDCSGCSLVNNVCSVPITISSSTEFGSVSVDPISFSSDFTFVETGTYEWTLACYDGTGLQYGTESNLYTLAGVGFNKPVITSPGDGITTDSEFNVTFTVALPIAGVCTFDINGTNTGDTEINTTTGGTFEVDMLLSGNYQYNVTCTSDGQTNVSDNRNIIIDVNGPVITNLQSTNSSVFPEIGDTVNLSADVSDDGLVESCYIEVNDNGTFTNYSSTIINQQNATYETQYTVRVFSTGDNSLVSWRVVCTDNTGNPTISSTAQFDVVDLTIPLEPMLGSQSSIQGDNSIISPITTPELTLDVYFADFNLFQAAINITCGDTAVHYWEELNFTTQEYTYFNDSIDISGLEPQQCELFMQVSDDHTAIEIPDYNINEGDGFIEYQTDNGAYVRVRAEDTTINTDTRKNKDRYAFEFEYDNKALSRLFTVTVDSDSILYFRPESDYPAHFVVWKNGKGNWVDFDELNTENYYRVERLNAQSYLVEVIAAIPKERINFKANKEEMYEEVLNVTPNHANNNKRKNFIMKVFSNVQGLPDRTFEMEDRPNGKYKEWPDDLPVVSSNEADNYAELVDEFGLEAFTFNSIGGVNIVNISYTFYIGGAINISSRNIYDNTSIYGWSVDVVSNTFTGNGTYYAADYGNETDEDADTTNLPALATDGDYNTYYDYYANGYANLERTWTYNVPAGVDADNSFWVFRSAIDHKCTTPKQPEYSYYNLSACINANSSVLTFNSYNTTIGPPFNWLYYNVTCNGEQLFYEYYYRPGLICAGFDPQFQNLSFFEERVDWSRLFNETFIYIDNLPNGTYDFTYNHPNYFPQADSNVVVENQTQDLAFESFQAQLNINPRNVKTLLSLSNVTSSVINQLTSQNTTQSDGAAPIPFYLNAGAYDVFIQTLGYDDYSDTVNLTYLENFTLNADLSFLTTFFLLNEETTEPFDLSIPNKVTFVVYCQDDRTFNYEVNSTNQTFPIVCNYDKFQFQVDYTNVPLIETTYFRDYILEIDAPITDTFNATVYLIDFNTSIPIVNYFVLDDLLNDYDNPRIFIRKNFEDGVQQITADALDIERKMTAYLIQNHEYTIEIQSDNLPTRVMGTYSADESGTKIIKPYEIGVYPQPTSYVNGITHVMYMDNSTGNDTAIVIYEDTANVTQELTVKFYVDDVSPGNLLSTVVVNRPALESGMAIIQDETVNNPAYDNRSIIAVLEAVYDTGVVESSQVIREALSQISLGILQYLGPNTLNWFIVLVLGVFAVMGTIKTANLVSMMLILISSFLVFMNWFAVSAIIIALAAVLNLLVILKAGDKR